MKTSHYIQKRGREKRERTVQKVAHWDLFIKDWLTEALFKGGSSYNLPINPLKNIESVNC